MRTMHLAQRAGVGASPAERGVRAASESKAERKRGFPVCLSGFPPLPGVEWAWVANEGGTARETLVP